MSKLRDTLDVLQEARSELYRLSYCLDLSEEQNDEAHDYAELLNGLIAVCCGLTDAELKWEVV